MTLHFDPAARRAGFSLLEMLVVLAVLAIITSIAAAGLRGPSSGLRLERQVAEMMADAARLRLVAIRTGVAQGLTVDDLTCDTQPGVLTFHRDGTASGPDLCLTESTLTRRLMIDPLTGTLRRQGEP